MLLNTGLFGDFRLSTLICWRSTRMSASSRALDRNSPVSAHPSSKRKSIIVHEHHPIRPSASPVWGFRQGQVTAMCGRYAVTSAPEAIRRLFGLPGPTPNFPPRYNAAPGLELPVVRRDPKTGDRVMGILLWSLIPYWSKDARSPGKCINARGETVKTTPAFREAYKARRCLVPADA
jgi:hypothetical protein